MKKNIILKGIFFTYLFVLGHISCTRMTTYSDRTKRSSSQSIVDQILNNNDLSSKKADQISKELAQALFEINGDYSNKISGFKQLLGVIAASGIASDKTKIGDNMLALKFDPLIIELRVIGEKLRSKAELINDSFQNRDNNQQISQKCIQNLQIAMKLSHQIFVKMSQQNSDTNLLETQPQNLHHNFKLIYDSMFEGGSCSIFDYLYQGGDQNNGPFIMGSSRLTGIFGNAMMLSLVEITITAQALKQVQVTTFIQNIRDAYQKISVKLNEIQLNFDQNMKHNLITIFSQDPGMSNVNQAYKIRDIIKIDYPEYGHFVQLWDDSENGNSQAIDSILGLEKLRVNYIKTRDYGYSQKKFIVLVSAERNWATSDQTGSDRADGAFKTYLKSFQIYGSGAFNGEGSTPLEFALWNNQQHLRNFNASPYWMVGYCIVKKNLNYVWADTNPGKYSNMNSLYGHAYFYTLGGDYYFNYWG